MKILSASLMIITAILLINCSSPDPVHPVPQVVDTDLCKVAQQHLIDLRCIPTNGVFTKKNKTFEEFCVETQEAGIFLNPRCIAQVKDCKDESIDACTRVSK